MSELRAVHPVLNVRDVRASISWYVAQLGFEERFVDDGDAPNYGGIGRDEVEVHLQWHSPEEWDQGLTGSTYRFLVADPDALFVEFVGRSDLLDGRQVEDTAWGTREFGLYDPDRNALFFYRDLDDSGN
ncbi:MAG: VOC family protein [Actinomycetota bacterium]